MEVIGLQNINSDKGYPNFYVIAVMKDERYIRVKALIESKHIKAFNDIFKHISQAAVYTDIGMGYAAFKTRFDNPSLYSLDELSKIARQIEIDSRVLIEMILLESESKNKTDK